MRDDDGLDDNPRVSRAALAELHGDLYGWALSRCGHVPHIAEDLMQQAYVDVLCGRARFDGRSSLKTFLFGVVQRLASNRYRRLATRLRLLGQYGSAAEPAAALPADDHGERVWAAVRALPARQRDVTELVFCRDLTIAEAALVIGISVGSARVHYDRAKKALAIALADLAGGHDA